MLNIYKSETKNLGHIKVVREALRKLKSYDYSQRPHKGKLFYERFNLFSWHPRVDGTSPEIVCEILKNTRFNNVFKTSEFYFTLIISVCFAYWVYGFFQDQKP